MYSTYAQAKKYCALQKNLAQFYTLYDANMSFFHATVTKHFFSLMLISFYTVYTDPQCILLYSSIIIIKTIFWPE